MLVVGSGGGGHAFADFVLLKPLLVNLCSSMFWMTLD